MHIPKATRQLALALACMLLCACSNVYSPVPMGENPVALSAQEWEGTWLSTEGAIYISVSDAQTGKIKMTEIGGDNPEVMEIQIRSSGDWMFGTILGKESEEPVPDADGDEIEAGYLWGRVRIDSDQLFLWYPDVGKFTTLINDGTLPGKVGKKDKFGLADVHLDELSAGHYEIIASSSNGVLMKWDVPLAMIRFRD